MTITRNVLLALLCWGELRVTAAESRVLDGRLHHLRKDAPREWDSFPEKPEASHWQLSFDAAATGPQTLELRQQDVKQKWLVLLNDAEVGQLRVDENDMVVYFELPAGAVKRGRNELRIEQDGGKDIADDIRVGEVVLHEQPLSEVLDDASIELQIESEEDGDVLPGRITIIGDRGHLQSFGANPGDHRALRPGVLYTSGQATITLPAGSYTIFAGRGFEYSLANTQVTVAEGDSLQRTLRLRRQVATDGYVACDTHVHTLTYSGHGDASLAERMMTLAGEGIELPVATDHNVHVDYDKIATQLGVRQYFTPVIGNEVTTSVGHFNIFPVTRDARVPDHRLTDWDALFQSIFGTPGVRVAILNHARDLHSGTRPFGPELFNSAAGVNLEAWQLRANGMEVINSAATQTDIMQLFRDWMTLLNAGQMITPVGSSDSHDVARHFVGQGRTYIRVNDHDPANIDVNEAVDNFLQGQVMVSYGLLVEMIVDSKYHSGDLVPAPGDSVAVDVRVRAPHWIQADRVQVFANGVLVRDEEISPQLTGAGVEWRARWILPCPGHDVHLVAIATGPGIDKLYWPTAKPYQPTSSAWQSKVLGCSGALWLDGDGDGRKTPAREYAVRSMARAGGELERLVSVLGEYDQAVATQAAHLWVESDGALLAPETDEQLRRAPQPVREGFRVYRDAWRLSQQARSSR